LGQTCNAVKDAFGTGLAAEAAQGVWLGSNLVWLLIVCLQLEPVRTQHRSDSGPCGEKKRSSSGNQSGAPPKWYMYLRNQH